MSTVIAPDGTNLHVVDIGTGPTVVMLHGWTVGAELCEPPLATCQATSSAALVKTRRGCGHSAGRGPATTTTRRPTTSRPCSTTSTARWMVVTHSLAVGEAVRYLSRYGSSRVRAESPLATSRSSGARLHRLPVA